MGQPYKIKITPESLYGCSKKFLSGADDIAAARQTLARSLSGIGGMAGNDESGKRWAASFDKAVTALFRTLGAAVNSVNGMGEGLTHAANNVLAADQKSAIGHSGQSFRYPLPKGPYSWQSDPGIPSAAGSGSPIWPSPLNKIPNGHQDRLRAAATDLWHASVTLQDTATGLEQDILGVTNLNSATSVDAMNGYFRLIWSPAAGQKKAGPLYTAWEACGNLAQACEDYAAQIDKAHHDVEMAIPHAMEGWRGWLAGVVTVAGIALSFFTATGSDELAAGIDVGLLSSELYPAITAIDVALGGILGALDAAATMLEGAADTAPVMEAVDAEIGEESSVIAEAADESEGVTDPDPPANEPSETADDGTEGVTDDVINSGDNGATDDGVPDRPSGADPVDLATGDVILAETDVELPGVLPLVIERSHRSSLRTGRWFGRSWMSSFDQRLVVTPDRVTGAFADGRVLAWTPPNDTDVTPSVPVTGPAWPLRQDPDGSYAVTDPQQGLTWRFGDQEGSRSDGNGVLPLVSITDLVGHEIVFRYDEDGQPLSVTHSGGYHVRVTVADERVTGLALAGHDGEEDVQLRRFAYDEDGNLSGVVNSSGLELRFRYDDAGRLTGWTDRNDYYYRYSYDSQGRCVRGEGPDDALSGTFAYEPGITRWTDHAGAVTTYEITGSARLAAITDPVGGTTRWEHDDRGNVTTRVDPLGRVTRYAYDDRGNLTAVTRPDGSQVTARYDDLSQPVLLTGPDGNTWRQEYDERGNRTLAEAPDGTVTTFGYDDQGHLATITAPDGTVTSLTCDATGLPTELTGPDGNRTRYETDTAGHVVRIIDPDGSVARLDWTPEGKPLSSTFPGGGTQSWEWDGEGNLTRHVSPAGAVTAYEYGPFDIMTAITWADGTRTVLEYDHERRLTGVEHGGLNWRYEYDPAGRLTAETDYNGAVARYSCDAAGQLTGRVNAAGQEISFRHDPLGNLIARLADGTETTFGYDASGRLVLARNPDAEISFERDLLGRVISETCNGRTVRTSYDAAGRITGRLTPSGASTTWTYNASGLPTALTAGGQELRFGYDIHGQEISRALPGGVTLAQGWDPLGRLTSQTVTGPARQSLQRRSYSYDPDGFVTRVEDLLTGTRTFGLDPAGRVTTVDGPQWQERYSYDPAGNMAAATLPAPPSGASVPWGESDPQGGREITGTLIRRAGTIHYHYDSAGRVITRIRTRISRRPDTWHYQWDAENRLTSVMMPDKTTWRYQYDPLGRRIAKLHLDASGAVLGETQFTWNDALLAEQAESEVDGELITTWDYQPGSFTPVAQQSRSSRNAREAPQEEIDRRFYSIVTDLVGTPAELIAPDGTVAGHQRHTLWGGMVWDSAGASTPLRFPGQYDDPETGLHYNNQRYYDPVTGAYLSPDPLGLAPAFNPHTYVTNPHTLTDPLGLAPGNPTECRVMTSAIGDDKTLVEEADKLRGKTQIQKSMDNLFKELSKGNMNPGIGTKALEGTDIRYARSRDGARLFFRDVDGVIQVVGKADKSNESKVIARLMKIYGK